MCWNPSPKRVSLLLIKLVCDVGRGSADMVVGTEGRRGLTSALSAITAEGSINYCTKWTRQQDTTHSRRAENKK